MELLRRYWNHMETSRAQRWFFAVAFLIPDVFPKKADVLNEWRQTEVGMMKQHSGFQLWMWWDPNSVWWSARVWLMSNSC